MLNSHSISGELWVYAHKCLVFYFTRRRCQNAEDLAQETLMTVWQREDFRFEKEEDFLKVCYGFARHILQQGYRDVRKHAADELTPDIERPSPKVQGLQRQELQVFLGQVRSLAETDLLADELALIMEAMKRDGHGPPFSSQLRVKLHRARKKLRKITGWGK
jgi:DNA-directed RNA polymerase specialized sigma24 family protein